MRLSSSFLSCHCYNYLSLVSQSLDLSFPIHTIHWMITGEEFWRATHICEQFSVTTLWLTYHWLTFVYLPLFTDLIDLSNWQFSYLHVNTEQPSYWRATPMDLPHYLSFIEKVTRILTSRQIEHARCKTSFQYNCWEFLLKIQNKDRDIKVVHFEMIVLYTIGSFVKVLCQWKPVIVKFKCVFWKCLWLSF